MKFTLNNFYSNNYKDFIHLEALKNILRKVPELNLAGLENIENVLSMEFSVDDWGENPMYIKYVDTDGKEHIVKIRPAVTEQIYEILKAYAKISYVDEQDKKLKDELHTEITQGDENALNLSKAYTDTVVNHAKDEINHTIETTKQELKGYCDNKCEITLASSKEYTDTKAHELSQRIETGDTETLETSKNYTDTQLAGYETKADAKAEHDKLSAEAENANKVYGYDISTGTWNKCNGNFTVSYDNSSITKLGYRQNNEDVEKSIDFTKLATNQQVTSNKEAIANNSNRIDTANQLITANDKKTTQALADVNTRIDNIPRSSEITLGGATFKERLNVETDTPDDFYSTVSLEQRDGSDSEFVGRLVKGDVVKKSDLDAINGDVSGILSWKESVDNKLEQKRLRMFEVRPEEYTPLNGATIDRENSYTRFFQFDNYAFFITDVAINHLTMNTWTYKELVSFPKAYLEHFSHFQHFTNTILTADGSILYNAGLDFDKANLTIYSRGTEINDANINLLIGGILYNQKGSEAQMVIYCFDKATKKFIYTDVIEESSEVPENATTIAPVNDDGTGMYAPTWDGTKWVSMTKEEYQEKYEQQQVPEGVPTITENQKQEAQFMIELTKMKANIVANTKMTATLAKQLAQTNLKDKEVK